MSFRLLLALALIGSCMLVNATEQQERYKYVGDILTGVVNPRQAHSGSRIELDVIVNRRQQKSTVEFKNARVAQINKMFIIGDMPKPVMQGQPTQGLNGIADVYFDRQSGPVMEVDSSEKHWVTELRKAVINMLRVPPYIGGRDFVDINANTLQSDEPMSAQTGRQSYQKTEQTFAGKCNVSYTMTPDVHNGRWPGSPNSVLPSGHYYRLHRSIDFDSCHQPVLLQKASHGNFSQVYRSQFKAVHSRSAVSEYLIRRRDDGSRYDIKGIVQEGVHYIRPFGQNTGRLITHTNQTLSLMEVKQHVDQISVSGNRKQITTWNYQFVSPAAPRPQTQVPWVVYQSKDRLHPVYPEYAVLGEAPDQAHLISKTNEILSQIVQLQMQIVEDHRAPYNGTSMGRATEVINHAAHVIRSLSYNSIKSLYQSIPKGQTREQRLRRQAFLDASISSGSAAALKAMIEEAKARRIDNVRVAGLVTAYMNNIIDPAALTDLMDFVMQHSFEEHGIYRTSMVHMNFAKLAQKVCIDHELSKYSVPLSYLGNKACNREYLVQKFEPYLRTKIRTSPKEYQSLVYLQALGSLGLDTSIPFIRDAAFGKLSPKKSIRLAAIHTLAHNYRVNQNLRDQVMLALLPIAENHGERFEFREAAFMTLVSMNANQTFFQRMAMDTWRDPSYRMRSLVTATFIGLAQSDSADYARMSNVARKLLPMLRPVQPSMQNSVYFNVARRVPSYNIDVHHSLAWLDRYMSSNSRPRQMYKSVKSSFGGVRVSLMEVFGMIDSQNIPGLAQTVLNPRNRHQKMVHQEMSEVTDKLQMEITEGQESLYSFLSTYNYQFFFGLDKETRPSIERTIKDWVKQNSNKPPQPFVPDHMMKYFNPVDVVSLMPTPFGSPAITETVAPNNWVIDATYTMTSDPEAEQYVNITTFGKNNMVMKTQCFMNVLMPWVSKTASSGYDTEASLNIPGTYGFSFNSSDPFLIARQVISPDFRGEKPLLYYRSKPMSVLRPLGPVSDLTTVRDMIVPVANRTGSYNQSWVIPRNIRGLEERITYQGDTDFPFQQSNLISILQNPSKLITLLTTPTQYDVTLAYRQNIDRSETKNISVAAVVDVGYLRGDYKSYTNKNLTPEQLAQKMVDRISTRNSPESLVSEFRRGELGDFLMSLSANYTVPNVRSRQFLIALAGANQTSSPQSRLHETVVFNVMGATVPPADDDRKLCVSTVIEEKSHPEQTSSQTSQVYTTAKSLFMAGKQCSQSEQVATVESRLYLSRDEKDRQKPVLSSSYLSQRSRPAWIVDAIYDRMDVEVTSKPQMPRWYQNLTDQMVTLVEGSVYPHLVKNHVGNSQIPQGKTIANLTRDVQGSLVTAWIQRNDEIRQLERYPVPVIVDWATPLLGNRVPYRHHISDSPSSSLTSEQAPDTKCIVRPEGVSTFDGVRYSKLPVTCWTVFAQVYHRDDSFTVLAKQVEHRPEAELEMKILDSSALKIELLRDQIKVNERVMSESSMPLVNSEQKTVGRIEKTPTKVTVIIEGKMKLVVEDRKIMNLDMSKRYMNVMSGICGDFNGEKAADLRSPKRCIFLPSQGRMYAASWIVDKDQCSDSAMRPVIQQVERFERNQCRTEMSLN